MCESHAFLVSGEGQELVLEDVVRVSEEGGEVRLVNIIGEEKSLPAEVAVIDLLNHRILLAPRG